MITGLWARLAGLGALIATGWLVWWLIGDNAVLRADLEVQHDKVQAIIGQQAADRASQQEMARLIRQTPDRARVVAGRLRNLPAAATGQPADSRSGEPAGCDPAIAQAGAEVSEEAQLLKRELLRLNDALRK